MFSGGQRHLDPISQLSILRCVALYHVYWHHFQRWSCFQLFSQCAHHIQALSSQNYYKASFPGFAIRLFCMTMTQDIRDLFVWPGPYVFFPVWLCYVMRKFLGKLKCPTFMLRTTVEPRPVDTPLLWTPNHCGHFSPGPFGFPYTFHVIKFH